MKVNECLCICNNQFPTDQRHKKQLCIDLSTQKVSHIFSISDKTALFLLFQIALFIAPLILFCQCILFLADVSSIFHFWLIITQSAIEILFFNFFKEIRMIAIIASSGRQLLICQTTSIIKPISSSCFINISKHQFLLQRIRNWAIRKSKISN